MEKSVDPRSIEVFLEVCKQRSISKAAAVLDLPASHVSRRLKDLEGVLGITLINRSTRHFELTEIGFRYAEICAEGFLKLNEGRDYIESMKGAPQGLVRMLCPFEFGQYLCDSFVGGFTEKYPNISLNLFLKNRASFQDYSSYDVFIEVGKLFAPPNFIQKKIKDVRRYLYCSPAFARRHQIRGIDDLLPSHIIDLLSDRDSTSATDLTLEHAGTKERKSLTSKNSVRINSLTGAKKIALNGGGVCLVPEFVVLAELERGELISICDGWSSLPVEIFTAVDPARKSNPKVAVLLEALGS